MCRCIFGYTWVYMGILWESDRAATKTTEIPDRLDPPSRHKNYKHSRFAGWLLLLLVVGWLVVVVYCLLLVGCYFRYWLLLLLLLVALAP